MDMYVGKQQQELHEEKILERTWSESPRFVRRVRRETRKMRADSIIGISCS